MRLFKTAAQLVLFFSLSLLMVSPVVAGEIDPGFMIEIVTPASYADELIGNLEDKCRDEEGKLDGQGGAIGCFHDWGADITVIRVIEEMEQYTTVHAVNWTVNGRSYDYDPIYAEPDNGVYNVWVEVIGENDHWSVDFRIDLGSSEEHHDPCDYQDCGRDQGNQGFANLERHCIDTNGELVIDENGHVAGCFQDWGVDTNGEAKLESIASQYQVYESFWTLNGDRFDDKEGPAVYLNLEGVSYAEVRYVIDYDGGYYTSEPLVYGERNTCTHKCGRQDPPKKDPPRQDPPRDRNPSPLPRACGNHSNSVVLAALDSDNSRLIEDGEVKVGIAAWTMGSPLAGTDYCVSDAVVEKLILTWVDNIPVIHPSDEAVPAVSVAHQLSVSSVAMNFAHNAFNFKAHGQGIDSVDVQIFDLNGRLIASGNGRGNTLSQDAGYHPANGAYLYIVTATGFDGSVHRSGVQKMFILN